MQTNKDLEPIYLIPPVFNLVPFKFLVIIFQDQQTNRLITKHSYSQ